MTPFFAIMEHSEKVPYLLSLFFPVVAFFFFGLGLSYWRNQSDMKDLKEARTLHEELVKELSPLAADLEKVSSQITSPQPKALRLLAQEPKGTQQQTENFSLEAVEDSQLDL